MTCQPERVTAFVDGALNEGERTEIETHLAQCDQCREQARAEVGLRERLGALPAVEVPPAFETEVRLRIRRERARVLRTWLPLAAALVVGALWTRNAAPFVSWELARDHGHCFGLAKLPAEVWSNDASVVASWFEKHGRTLPYLPDKVSTLELVGARRCPLVDRSVAHLYYVGGGSRRLSLFVVPGSVRFDEAYSAQRRGMAVRLIRVSGCVVGLVGERDEDVGAFEDAFTTTLAQARIGLPKVPPAEVDHGQQPLLRWESQVGL